MEQKKTTHMCKYLFGFIFVISITSTIVFSNHLYNDSLDISLMTPYGPATIKTDSYGIPSISAQNELAASYATGYAQAKDRLWSMQFLKIFASGRMSEAFGPDMIEIDKLIRSFGFTRYAKTMLHKPVGYIESFAQGINDYVKSSLMLPLEFFLVGCKFEPWKVEDTLLIAKLMSFESSYRWIIIVSRQAILEKYGKTIADIIIPINLDQGFGKMVTVINEQELTQNGQYKQTPHNEPDLEFNFKKYPENLKFWTKSHSKDTKTAFSTLFAGASNSWAIHGNYTKSGKPLIACDPHLGTRVPSILYMARINVADYNYFGALLPGVPYILYGRSQYVAWGATVAFTENIDQYKIKINRDITHYFYNKTWKPLKVYEETIKVKNGQDVKIKTYETHHGPLVLPPSLELLSVPSYFF